MAGTGNRIKGITIEIEGNTTKLSDSLRKVDDDLSETQKALKDVNKLLKLDPHNTELLRQKTDLLNKAIDDTNDKLKQEREALKQLEAGPQTAETVRQQEALKREIIDGEKAVASYKKQLDNLPSKLDAVGAAAQKVADKTRAVSAAAAGLGAALLGNAYKAALAADDLNTLARNTGLSVEELQKMQYASDLVDVSVDQMTGAMKKLVKQMGSGSKAFDELGISIYDADGNLRDSSEVFYESLEALSHVSNETERDTLAMELFGKSAMDLSGIIDDGGKALKEYGQFAEDAGLIMSGDLLDSANEFNDAVDTMKASIQQGLLKAGAQLATTLAPAMQKIADAAVKVSTWFASLDGSTQGLILGVLGLVAAISPLASMIAAISTVAASVGPALAFISGPIGAAILAITALISVGGLLITHWEEIKTYVVTLKDNMIANFGQMRDSVVGAFDTIVTWAAEMPSKVANGILEQIGLAQSAAEQFGQGILDKLSSFFDQMKQVGSDLIKKVKDGIDEAFHGIGDFLSGIGSSIVDGIWNGISGAIDRFTENIRGFFSGIVDSVKTELDINSPSKVFEWIGQMMGEGLSEGWDKSISGFNPAANILASTGGAALAAGGNSYGFTNNINLYGQYSERDGMRIAQSIDKWLGERL